jgi:LAO/AO transport system kinase
MSESASRPRKNPFTVEQYVTGVRDGDRTILARAITLFESLLPADRHLAQEVLTKILPATGQAVRVGISGVPGVGKSTFIESLGMMLTRQGHQVAVLAVDPSSAVSGGSILGDKSRMPHLAASPAAFIRPSPNALTTGGVGRRTRETMLLCEAAGFDVVIIETVGVGQSETMVAEMVDFFMVLLLAGGGDELQGIKKGILELADLLAVNKADGENHQRALIAQQEYRAALRYLPSRSSPWQAPVLLVSGLTGDGLEEVWRQVQEHRSMLASSGQLETRRREQNRQWMWSLIEERLKERFLTDSRIRQRLPELEGRVLAGSITPTMAAEELLRLATAPGEPIDSDRSSR